MFHKVLRKPDLESNFAVINERRQWLELPLAPTKDKKNYQRKGLLQFGVSKL
jgi:hypothetical protein